MGPGGNQQLIIIDLFPIIQGYCLLLRINAGASPPFDPAYLITPGKILLHKAELPFGAHPS